jgi:formamidopyrimidine-DNA glycosylase
MRSSTIDEALFQARIDPRRPVPSLSGEERDDLYRKVRKVVRDSLPFRPSEITNRHADRQSAG